MINQGLELKVNRNETFTIDYSLSYPDGTPYIISAKLENAYIVLSVTNSLFDQPGRYSKRWWLPTIQPKFYKTTPTKVEALTDDVKFIMFEGDLVPQVVDVIIDNVRKFMYWDVNTSSWLEYYPVRIVKTFTKSDVSEWKENDYLYSITLVDGESMYSGIKTIFTELGYEGDYTLDQLIEILSSAHPEILEGIDLTSPLYEVITTYPIITPTSLTVNADISRRF